MGKPRRSAASSISGTAPRIERKIIEKNRRTRMKTLYFNLFSLLPDYTSKQIDICCHISREPQKLLAKGKVEGLPLPDQVDETVEHIKSMKMKLEKLRQKKESLLRGKRSINDSCITSENQAATNKKSSPLVEVHDMGPNLDVVIANGLQDYSSFHDIIRSIHQHGAEIASASFARDGNSTIQVLQEKVGQPKLGFEDATMSRKLKELVPGTSSGSEVVESELNLWDYEIESYNIWGFGVPQVLPAGDEPNAYFYM